MSAGVGNSLAARAASRFSNSRMACVFPAAASLITCKSLWLMMSTGDDGAFDEPAPPESTAGDCNTALIVMMFMMALCQVEHV
jgi:hypothetical protein